LVGQHYKGKNVIKTVSLHNVKITPTQRKSVRAFEKLNRLASAVSKNWFEWLDIEQGQMLKHNAVAKHFKMCIVNHEFDITQLQQIFPANNMATINEVLIDRQTGLVTIDITSYVPGIEMKVGSLYVIVFDEDMKIYYAMGGFTQSPKISFYLPAPRGVEIQCCCFASWRLTSGYRFGAWAYNATISLPIYENGVLYTSRMKNVNTAIAPAITLQLSGNIVYNTNKLVYPAS